MRFFGHADFCEATFSRDAEFNDVTFTQYAWFNEATFLGTDWFGGARFTEPPNIEGAISGWLNRTKGAKAPSDQPYIPQD